MSRTEVIPFASSSGRKNSRLPPGSPAPVRCKCMSLKPGIRNLPRPSITFAPRGTPTEVEAPSAMIFPLSSKTVSSGAAAAPVMSITVTCAIATTELCGSLHAPSKQHAATSIANSAANCLRFKRASWIQSIVFFQNGAKLFMIERDRAVIFNSSRRFRGDHRVHDRFFHGLHRGGKNGIEICVGKHLQIRDALFLARAGIRGGKRDENISRAVAGNASVAAKPERDAARKPFELMRKKRRIGCDDDDNRSALRIVETGRGVRRIFGNFLADRNSRDTKLRTAAVIALHERGNGESSFAEFHDARGSSDAALEFIADHSGAAAD